MRDSDALFQQLELLKINRGHSQYHGRVCGKGEKFNRAKVYWQYVEQLGCFLEANRVTNADKRQYVFLKLIGPTTFKLLCNLVYLHQLSEKSYKDFV